MRGDEVKEMKSKGPDGKAWKAAGPCSAFLIILIFSSIVVIVVMRNICMKTGSLFIVSVFFSSFLILFFSELQPSAIGLEVVVGMIRTS